VSTALRQTRWIGVIARIMVSRMRYALTDLEWAAFKPHLPSKSRGVPRVDDRKILNGIFWVLRSGAPWRDLPALYGPYTTCYNRFVRWARAGIWDGIMRSLKKDQADNLRMIHP
jgi:transposase